MRGRFIGALFAVAILWCGPAFAEGILVLQARTDAEPVSQFQRIRTTITGDRLGEPLVFDHAASPGAQYLHGVRLAELTLEDGIYLLDVQMFHLGAVVVEQAARVEIDGGVEVVTLLLTVWRLPCEDDWDCETGVSCIDGVCGFPQFEGIQPFKQFRLENDADGSESVTPGDTLRYTVAFETTHPVVRGSTLTDAPSASGRLIPGSVTTTHGIVFQGNLPSDEALEVRFNDPIIRQGTTVAITYDVEVRPRISNQANVWIRVPGELPSYAVLSDDPSTPLVVPDPTITEIECGGQGDLCCGDLHECSDALAKCTPDVERLRTVVADLRTDIEELVFTVEDLEGINLELASELTFASAENTELRVQVDQLLQANSYLTAELEALREDPDGDGVAANADECPGTPAEAQVDQRGCSRPQFCAERTGGRRWRRRCRRADWLDDALQGPPRDCVPRRRKCVPR